MPAGHGGRRPGAGRPAGTRDKKVKKIAVALGANGITPLEVLINGMRIAWDRSVKEKHNGPHLLMALTCAEKAAPYIHPRMATVQHQTDVDAKLDITIRHLFTPPPEKVEQAAVNGEAKPMNGHVG